MRSYIMPTIGYHVKELSLMIFQPQMLSLFEILNSGEKQDLLKQLDSFTKYHICFELARILYTLHHFSPPICHGHITSHNVFLDMTNTSLRRCKVRLGDLELMPLLKYANTFYSYRNASVWSSPECLQNLKKL